MRVLHVMAGAEEGGAENIMLESALALAGAGVAQAVVTRTNMIEMVLKLYFSYYPLLTRLLVTDKEAEARAWLDAQFKELGRAGR